MPGAPQQEFRLERTEVLYGTGEGPTLATLRQAGHLEHSQHEQFLADLQEKAARLIELGSKCRSPLYASFCSDSLWHLRYGSPHPKQKIIDDRLHRFMWVRDYIECSMARFEIRLTLTACNILDEFKKPIFGFEDGRLVCYPSLDFGDTSLSTWEEEIHEKILEVNPDWKGALEELFQALIDEHHLGYQTSNIKDWPIESIFSQSANYLYSLLEEINRAVFNGMGKIRDDAAANTGTGSTQGFALYIPKHTWNPNNLGYIGVRENGKFEIRVHVLRDRSEYWDTDLRGVIDTLQQAIIWWKECGEYSEEERIQHEDDEKRARLEKEAKAFRSEAKN